MDREDAKTEVRKALACMKVLETALKRKVTDMRCELDSLRVEARALKLRKHETRVRVCELEDSVERLDYAKSNLILAFSTDPEKFEEAVIELDEKDDDSIYPIQYERDYIARKEKELISE